MSLKKIYAIINLGIFFFLHLLIRLKRLFTGRPNGFQRFKRYYLEDRITEYSKADRDKLPAFERCINCGMCVFRCELHKRLSRNVFPGMNILVSGQSKSSTEAWTAREIVNAIDFNMLKESLKCCEDCIGCERTCPNEVPLTQILRFVQEKLREGLYGQAQASST